MSGVELDERREADAGLMAPGNDTLSQAEIDALLAAVASEPNMATASVPSGVRIQNMDFRRPSKFNKDQLRTLEMLHDTFARLGATYLSGALRAVADISVLGAEQVTYGEFISSLPVPAFTNILELEPLETNAILALDLPLIFSMIDRLLGGTGQGAGRLRELTDIELSLSRTIINRLLAELSTSWSELVGVDFHLRHTEMNPQFAQIAPPTELSVLLSFQIRVGDSTGVMTLCLPWRSIETVAPSLTANSYFSGQRTGAATLDLLPPPRARADRRPRRGRRRRPDDRRGAVARGGRRDPARRPDRRGLHAATPATRRPTR